jgi:N,N'-diacetyllegionaminate synthase
MKTLIIAEAGVNHNGNLEIAKSLIEVAKNAGADFVKFQLSRLINLLQKKLLKLDTKLEHRILVKRNLKC